MKRILGCLALLALAACDTLQPEPGPSPPPPASGTVLYTCANGAQLSVDFENGQARVAIVGGVSMSLPLMGNQYYTNGRYGLRGSRESAMWEVGRAAPVACRGS